MSEMMIKAYRGASYNIVVTNSFDELADKIKNLNLEGNKVCIITDEKVDNLYGDFVISKLSECGYECLKWMPAVKEDSDLKAVLDEGNTFLCDNEFLAGDIVVSLAGCLITDIACYIAANYKEELSIINVPTSLGAMVESGIDGKAGSMLEYICNVKKVIKFPKLVYCNVSCIQSLDARDYYCGFAYVMKAAIVKSSSVYEWLIDKLYEISDREPQIVLDMVEQCISFKKIYMEKDPLCVKGDQMLMDLGTTIGWALYKTNKYGFKLGECITIGIIASAHISMKRNMLSLDEYLEIRDMFVPFNLPISVENLDIDEVVGLAMTDPKCDEAGKCFVLLKKIGKAVIDRSVNEEEIKEALAEIRFSDDDYVVE